MPKKMTAGTLYSLSVWYVTRKREKPFWIRSLGQMIQFGTIKFCRSFLVSSCGLKKVTIIVAFHFMKGRLKMFYKETFRCPKGFFGEIDALFSEKGLKFRRKFKKNSEKFKVERFHEIFVFFRKTKWLRMLKMFNMEKLVVTKACVKK